jgi:BAG domain/Ubiquitin family
MSSIFSWSPFSRSQSTPQQEPETIEIHHGKQTLRLTFPPGTLEALPVAELKSQARKEARLPDDMTIKLLFQGKRLDDKDTVGKYNVRNGSRILMTSSKKPERPPSESRSGTSTPKPKPTSSAVAPQTPLEKIAAIRQDSKHLYGERVSTFVKNPPSTRKERLETKERLNELLLQQLMKFDNVDISPDDFASNEARLERKAAIKWVQGLMDEIDKVDVNVPE